MVTGIDEWVWTAYCCTDTHFGSEETVQYYHENGLNAPTGGETSTVYPIWNPREYFLLVPSCRMKQTIKEWSSVVIALESGLKYYVRRTIDLVYWSKAKRFRRKAFLTKCDKLHSSTMWSSPVHEPILKVSSSCVFCIMLLLNLLNHGKALRAVKFVILT